jgi:hypothetical protein
MPHFSRLRRHRKSEEQTMLDTFTPDQKASILTQVMREESQGRSLRDCCKAQGITVQTFIDWKARAQRHNQFDTLHMNGIHPERKPARFRKEKPKTALQIALEAAQVRSYPDDNPEDLHAVEHGEPAPPAQSSIGSPPPPALAPESPPETPLAAAAPEVIKEPVYPIYEAVSAMLETESETQPEPDSKPVISNEVTAVPKQAATPPASKPRGVAATMHIRMPWLAAIDKRTEKALGPKPANKEPGYTAWIAHRKTLMTDEQRAEIEAFFGVAARGRRAAAEKPVTKKRQEQASIAAARGGIEVAPVKTNGHVKVSPEIQALAAQHAEVTGQIAEYQHAPTRSVVRGDNFEVERLKKALTALTLENLQLRGLL